MPYHKPITKYKILTEISLKKLEEEMNELAKNDWIFISMKLIQKEKSCSYVVTMSKATTIPIPND